MSDMTVYKSALSTRIRAMLFTDDLELFVDLCRQYNCIIKCPEFKQIIDNIEMFLMVNYTDDSVFVVLQNNKILDRVLYFVTQC